MIYNVWLQINFKRQDLAYTTNNWSSIYDFTPVPGENNYGLIPNVRIFTEKLKQI